MKIPLTPQLVGDLIEKGYVYMLASNEDLAKGEGEGIITLKPVREKPELNALPDGFETYYRITREPIQFACGVEGISFEVDFHSYSPDVTGEDVFEDSYFRMSEDFFHKVLDSLEDYAVITTDKNGDVNSWNKGAEKLMGFTEKEIIGHSADIFFTPEDRAHNAPRKEMEFAIKDGRAIDERYHMRKDRSRFWGTGLMFPLYDDYNNHRGFTKIMRNLREQQEAKSQGAPQ
ncbi:PAS domain S-box protein [Mucilaginibacter achroorhodeus]|uniref:PAS domain S-box protein n=1 Tax=Mucilaginibacter achroorhodeus TaxID=2599294 RepID=A0A563U050_9SPHI|nr:MULTISPECIES: PAS domain S-box protein [Mucilaginibacter]QXV65557.1 PAS domain S-box protein [Mucilaginibacter sp. 21P]TWR25006.1 PAS domain S-box protein [Mucilaginibacter achroorhodeus]